MKFTAQLKLMMAIAEQFYQRSRAHIPEMVNPEGLVLLLPDLPLQGVEE